MFIKQISLFAENRNGAIMDITQVLRDGNINIRAFSIADTTDFGIVRLIVDDPDRAAAMLRENGSTVATTDVIAISMGDRPGALHEALTALYEGEIMIEYSYAFVAPTGFGATAILRCMDQEKAAGLLQKKGIRLLSQAEVSLS